MTAAQFRAVTAGRWVWWAAFGLLAAYVAVRMGGLALWVELPSPDGSVDLPNTYASVDHPFHVARAEILWREVLSGHALRWIGQHQGGYPVEFYPLGEAWLEVVIRGVSLGTLPAEGAHTIAVIAVFLLPGIAFTALAREDGKSPAVGLLALILHVSLPGSWYDGGYTELVQWGLVTNVAAAVASLLMIAALVRFLTGGAGWIGATAAGLAALAVYCNPRSLVGLAALGLGACIAATAETRRVNLGRPWMRLVLVAAIAALLAAPELLPLARFGGLYVFVKYSGYGNIGDYIAAVSSAVTWPVVFLALAGVAVGLVSRRRVAMRSVAIALALYVLLTMAVTFVPFMAALAPQLEPTRLMPLQRLLTLYLAAVTVWLAVSWLSAKVAPGLIWTPAVATTGLALVLLVIQTRPLAGSPPDPASPAIPPVSLYPVVTSARPEQADLSAAVIAADAAAETGTAILVLGSAMSWHQQLWAPLWTERPLYFDNWLWYWRADHVGTPGYVPQAGHHYPDPERTLEREYLDRHGVGAVVVTGSARDAAAASPLLEPLFDGTYDAYLVRNPVTTVTFGDRNATSTVLQNQRITASGKDPSGSIVFRTNWHPRWQADSAGVAARVFRRNDGYLDVASSAPANRVELVYAVQPLDWAARGLAAVGLAGLVGLSCWRTPGDGRPEIPRWYAPRWRGKPRDADDRKTLGGQDEDCSQRGDR